MNAAVFQQQDDDPPKPSPHRALAAMTVGDLDAVHTIECRAYAVPWTRGNFVDSLAAGHHAFVLRGANAAPLGYFVAMDGVDELHLLNLTVAREAQGRGHGGFMLQALVSLSRQRRAEALWLEVRESNEGARRLYERHGFTRIGVRRGYYPLPAGSPGREDAVVMSLQLRQQEGR